MARRRVVTETSQSLCSFSAQASFSLSLRNEEVTPGEFYTTIGKNILACLCSVWPNFVTNEGIAVTEQGSTRLSGSKHVPSH